MPAMFDPTVFISSACALLAVGGVYAAGAWVVRATVRSIEGDQAWRDAQDAEGADKSAPEPPKRPRRYELHRKVCEKHRIDIEGLTPSQRADRLAQEFDTLHSALVDTRASLARTTEDRNNLRRLLEVEASTPEKGLAKPAP